MEPGNKEGLLPWYMSNRVQTTPNQKRLRRPFILIKEPVNWEDIVIPNIHDSNPVVPNLEFNKKNISKQTHKTKQKTTKLVLDLDLKT